MSKTRKRYVVELTEAQLKALTDCAIYGRETCGLFWISDDEKTISKGYDGIRQLYIAKNKGLKTLK